MAVVLPQNSDSGLISPSRLPNAEHHMKQQLVPIEESPRNYQPEHSTESLRPVKICIFLRFVI